MENRTIEELRAEKKRLSDEVQKLREESKKIDHEIHARTSPVNKYIGEFIKESALDYNCLTYLYVKTADESFSDQNWTLRGKGFRVYKNPDGTIKFNNDPYGIEIDLENPDKYSKIEIISREEFYSDREKFLKEVGCEICDKK